MKAPIGCGMLPAVCSLLLRQQLVVIATEGHVQRLLTRCPTCVHRHQACGWTAAVRVSRTSCKRKGDALEELSTSLETLRMSPQHIITPCSCTRNSNPNKSMHASIHMHIHSIQESLGLEHTPPSSHKHTNTTHPNKPSAPSTLLLQPTSPDYSHKIDNKLFLKDKKVNCFVAYT